MHQRPQRPIAHPIVVLRDVALAQFHERELETRMSAGSDKRGGVFWPPFHAIQSPP